MEPLEVIRILYLPHGQSETKQVMFLPDKGANVTAIAESDPQDVALSPTNVILRTADSNVLQTLGTYKATLALQSNAAGKRIHVVRGLSRPLLSRQMLKELGLIHKDFPHQDVNQISVVKKSDTPSTDEGVDTAHASQNREPPKNIAPIEAEHGPAFNKLVREYKDLFNGRCTQMIFEANYLSNSKLLFPLFEMTKF